MLITWNFDVANVEKSTEAKTTVCSDVDPVKFLRISHGVGRDATPWAIFLADLNQAFQQILDRIYDSKYIFTYII